MVTALKRFMDQLHNWENPRASYETLGPEILQAFPRVALVVGSLGSGGSLLGVAQYPATVRDVHARLSSAAKPLAYTTTLKTLQVMAEKGLVTRDESQRSHVYAAAVPQDQTQQKLVGDLLSRAFSGSLGTFIMQALSAKRATADELAEVRELVEEYERSLK